MAGVAITRMDLSLEQLRAAAKQASDTKLARRILAIAMVLDGFDRADAAQACGMDRQTLRDWVHRYNSAGIAGLTDRPRPGRPSKLAKAQQAELADWVEQGADLAKDGVARFRRIDLRDRLAERFAVSLHERSVGKILHRLGFSHMSVRPIHPQTDCAEQEAFKKTLPTSRARHSATGARASRLKCGSKTRPE